jgi:hypothetical protein
VGTLAHESETSARVTGSLAVDHTDEPQGWESTVAALTAEYTQYVLDEHARCRGCPVVRSGVTIVRSMLEWKAVHRDGRLHHWTRRDLRDYLLGYLPTANLSRALLPDAPTCAKDLVYFLADRGTLVGDDVGVLVDATDEVFYGYGQPLDLLAPRPKARAAERRRARRKAGRAARKHDAGGSPCPLS